MKHKVAELEGALLDAAVAIAEGKTPERVELTERDVPAGHPPFCFLGCGYSTHWEQAGPIIERERIILVPSGFDPHRGPGWTAGLEARDTREGYEWEHSQSGSTPLIAAMRAYVASKFGEDVELP